MTKRNFSRLASKENYLCITITEKFDTALVDALLKNIGILKRRFGFSIALVAIAPSYLGLENIRVLFSNGLIDQAAFSGTAQTLIIDSLSVAKRLTAKKIIFIRSDELTADFTSVVKFLVETLYDSRSFHSDRSVSLAAVDSNLVQIFQFETQSSVWNDFLQQIGSGFNTGYSDRCELPTQHLATESITESHHLFVSEKGIERLGGISKFLSLPIEIDTVPVNRFGSYWILTDDTDEKDHSYTVHGSAINLINSYQRIGESNKYLVFDINPAPARIIKDASEEIVSVPRQILFARIFEHTSAVTIPMPDSDLPKVVFAMSNFNKSRYIHSTLYSLILQTYPHVRVEIVDDISDDDSLDLIQKFCDLLLLPPNLIRARTNSSKRGTYWIRNFIINENIGTNDIYLVNDSDDYSSAQRARIQMAEINLNPETQGCFGDIVRVDGSYNLLPLNNQVERYGTASLGCNFKFHKEVGFFQNVRKNADTEYIERVKIFSSESAIRWLRYPLLFQPFDGGNLTADIYQMGQRKNALVQSLGNRSPHSEAFRRHHNRIPKKDISIHFSFPLASMPKEVVNVGEEYSISGYRGFDSAMLVINNSIDDDSVNKLTQRGFHVATSADGSTWRFRFASAPDFICDFGFLESLREYISIGKFYGYITSPSSPIVENSRSKPRSYLLEHHSHSIASSKADSDQKFYQEIDGRLAVLDSMSITSLPTLERFDTNSCNRFFFHSEAILNFYKD